MTQASRTATSAAVVAQNLALEHELCSVVSELERNGVEVIVLKGIPLLRRLNLSLGERKLADNDLLLHPSDVERAAKLLEGLGYRELPRYPLTLDLETNFQHVRARSTQNGLLFVELHWHALSPYLFDPDAVLWWQCAETLDLAAGSVRVLDPTLTLIQSAGHFIQHRLSEPRILRTLGAAWSRWGGEVEVESLRQLSTKIGATAALAYSLNAAAALGFTDRPAPFSFVRSGALAQLLPPARLLEPTRSPDYVRQALSWLLLDPGKASKLALRMVVPPLAEVRRNVGEDAGLLGLGREYLARPRRALTRYVRGC